MFWNGQKRKREQSDIIARLRQENRGLKQTNALLLYYMQGFQRKANEAHDEYEKCPEYGRKMAELRHLMANSILSDKQFVERIQRDYMDAMTFIQPLKTGDKT